MLRDFRKFANLREKTVSARFPGAKLFLKTEKVRIGGEGIKTGAVSFRRQSDQDAGEIS
jgi:hypothetical protein